MPFAKGWIRTHSACTHAQNSRMSKRFSCVTVAPTLKLLSKSANISCRLFSNAPNAFFTSHGATPEYGPILTPVSSNPFSPRNRPIYISLAGTRFLMVSTCHIRASSTDNGFRALASSRMKLRSRVRFAHSIGLSSSQSAMIKKTPDHFSRCSRTLDLTCLNSSPSAGSFFACPSA